MKNRLPGPSEIRDLDFKREFRRLGIRSVSATVGINRLIFDIRRNARPSAGRRKIPSRQQQDVRD
jgi:hypothetical protein